MERLLPFYLVGFGLFCMARGASGLLPALRLGRRAGPAAEGEAERRGTLRTARLDGLFWVVAGVVILRSVDVRTSWFAATIGLLGALGGAWGFFATFRRGGRSGGVEGPAASNAEPRGRTAARRLGHALLLGLGAVITFASGLHVGPAPASPRRRDGDGRLDAIVTRRVARAFEEGGRVGLVVGVVADGEAMLRGFGSRRLGSPEAPDADTIFEIGSLTKVFTGILLARRIEDGSSKLDDRVADLLPAGWSLPGPARSITLQHCTTHTSGLPRLPQNLMSVSGVFDVLFGGDPYREYGEGPFREALATVDLDREPGVELEYSNFAVGLLGFALATQAGSDYETLVREKICRPLGMADTTTVDDDRTRGRTAAKYRSALTLGPASLALGSEAWRLPNHLAGAGALRSTGRDVMAFLKANMGLVSTPIDAAIRRSHRELFRERDDRAVGMNWFRSYEPSLAQEVVWHNGGTGGFRSYLGFTEDRRFGVFALSNTAIGVDDLAKEILDDLVREFAPETRRLVTDRGYARVAPFTGVRWEGDRPIVRVQGRWRRLASLDGIPIDRVLEFARREFGGAARKRFAEDLVELLSKMGHEPRWDATLGLEDDEGKVELVEAPMTEENRERVRD